MNISSSWETKITHRDIENSGAMEKQPPSETDLNAALEELSQQTLGKTEKEIIAQIEETIATKGNQLTFQLLPFCPELAEPAQEYRENLPILQAELGNLSQIIPPGRTGKTLIVVPTQNKDKIKVGETFAQMVMQHLGRSGMDVNKPYQVIGRDGDSEAGNQPYTHKLGMKGACMRIINAHAKVRQEFIDRPEGSEIDFDNITEVLFIGFENHIVILTYQKDHLIAYDYPAVIFWNDTKRKMVAGIGPGVLVPPYYLRIARSCHYEKISGTDIEDKTKGLVTVGKCIELWSQKEIKGANWHPIVCGHDRYKLILDYAIDLYKKDEELFVPCRPAA